jgi:pyruvate formate lyase activating enzyme
MNFKSINQVINNLRSILNDSIAYFFVKRCHMKGVIFDIDHFAVHDGGGIRTSIYLKGCALNCKWCHSPESQKFKPELLFISSKCTGCGDCLAACKFGAQGFCADRKRFYNREACRNCGACVRSCAYEAMVLCGREASHQEVVEEAVQDIIFFQNSGGGVTLTGGEVLQQPDFAIDILKGLKEYGIHTIVETSGMGCWEHIEKMYPLVDLFYYDIKLMDPAKHLEFTGQRNDVILENLKKLRAVTDKIVLRVPLIPGYTDEPENINSIYKLAAAHKITEVHLLPYNSNAGAKYEWLGKDYVPGELAAQSKAYLELLKEKAPKQLSVKIIS